MGYTLLSPPTPLLAPPSPTPSLGPASGRPSPFPWATRAPSSQGSPCTTPSRSPSVGGWSADVEHRQPRPPGGFEFLDFGDGSSPYPRLRNFEWEVHGPAYPGTPLSLTRGGEQSFKRRMGPTEVSYYLGSKGDGVNDMYLHIGFRATPALVQPERIKSVWRELVSRHKVFACEADFEDDDEVYLSFPLERDFDAEIDRRLSLLTSTDPHAFISSYLNGPRTLSDRLLAKLVISTPSATFAVSADGQQEYDFFLFTTHFLGDGMALHTCADEFFTLLTSAPSSAVDASPVQITASVNEEWQGDDLALPMESLLPTPDSWGRMAWAAAKVDFGLTQGKLVGAQAFPRQKASKRHTIVPTVSYPPSVTSAMLKSCKANGVSLSQAVFALANIAYIRSGATKGTEADAMMLYSALNVRPWLERSDEEKSADWFHIAIGYYNIILPSFLPSSVSHASTFWHRCYSVKQQTSRVVKSPFLKSRTKLMALERERRSVGFERELAIKKGHRKLTDSLMGLGIVLGDERDEKPVIVEETIEKKVAPKPSSTPPSLALMGVSMLGNLDGMYKHKAYTGVELHTLTTGSRQRPGALLLFAYTFCGKFWLSLGYDQKGFKDGVVDRWWDEVKNGVDEFLVAKAP